MTVYIQQLPVAGSGDIVYPDAAMDAGTACLVDLVDAWAWGGNIPANGEAVNGKGVLNYALEDDGWSEAPGTINSAGLVGDGYGAVLFGDKSHYMTLPPAFCPPVGSTKFGIILWLASTKYDVESSINNTIFSISPATGVATINIFPSYTGSTIANLGFSGLGFNGGVTPLAAPMLDGSVHQIAVEFDITVGGTSYMRVYLDGAQLSQFSSTGATAVSNTLTRAIVGRQPAYNGQGLKGVFARAMMVLADTPGARSFAETVARDYALNAARLSY